MLEPAQRGRRASGRRREQVWRAQLYLTTGRLSLAVAAVSDVPALAGGGTHLGHHAHDEALLLNAVRLDRVRIL
jgi:hypothetical protein